MKALLLLALVALSACASVPTPEENNRRAEAGCWQGSHCWQALTVDQQIRMREMWQRDRIAQQRAYVPIQPIPVQQPYVMPTRRATTTNCMNMGYGNFNCTTN